MLHACWQLNHFMPFYIVCVVVVDSVQNKYSLPCARVGTYGCVLLFFFDTLGRWWKTLHAWKINTSRTNLHNFCLCVDRFRDVGTYMAHICIFIELYTDRYSFGTTTEKKWNSIHLKCQTVFGAISCQVTNCISILDTRRSCCCDSIEAAKQDDATTLYVKYWHGIEKRQVKVFVDWNISLTNASANCHVVVCRILSPRLCIVVNEIFQLDGCDIRRLCVQIPYMWFGILELNATDWRQCCIEKIVLCQFSATSKIRLQLCVVIVNLGYCG